MAHYLSRFPKRHIAWSNSDIVGSLDMGVLCREHQRMLAAGGVKSARTYLKNGKKKFVGTRHLKTSESGTWCFFHLFFKEPGDQMLLNVTLDHEHRFTPNTFNTRCDPAIDLL